MKKHNCLHPQCNKSFPKASLLNYHINTHTKAIKYECKNCDKYYYEIKHLKRHEKTHNDVKEYPCNCGLSFHEEYILKNHKKFYCKFIKKEMFCNFCGKTYKRESRFLLHKLKCQAKEINFDLKQDLINRKNLEETEKNISLSDKFIPRLNNKHKCMIYVSKKIRHKCKHCEKEFSKSYNLTVHIKRVHLNIREYACNCGKEYLYKHNLTKHQANCIVCGSI